MKISSPLSRRGFGNRSEAGVLRIHIFGIQKYYELRTLPIKGEAMKKRVFSLLLSSCVLALIAATTFAQLPGEPVRANIPFDFNINGKTLPAGEYEIARISDEADGLKITSVDHRGEHALFFTEPVQRMTTSRRGELIFHRYGEAYFLSEVWGPGLETGRELAPSRQERLLKRETASVSSSNTQQLVAIATY
ncbi:MAG: hypothetical protein C5B55_14330 [Blastocatellia bacterium]|nr:MAG: hypothetical protein C5B55_14330 [Blastocatellia bacterium]